VLVNLLDNAIKYSPDGGDVAVELAGGPNRVRLTVRDSGLGIPPGEQERIFEKFYRLDPALTRGVGGSGLGLFISRELVARMGGSLTVRSQQGEGAAFVVDLPAA
jgi:signal transduction histidine kinase